MWALTTLVVALNPATMPAEMISSERWDEYSSAHPEDSPTNGYFPQVIFIDSNVIGHVQLGKVRKCAGPERR